MSDDVEQPEMGDQEQPPAESAGSGPNAANDIAKELEETRAALKKANAEAAKRRKQLEAYEQAEQERKEAEMTEMEKLQKALSEREQELARLRLNDMKRKVARDAGLPDVLALRLQGDTEEALMEDAKALLETLPKTPSKPAIKPTNPGATARPEAETAAQRRKRLYSQNSNIFDPARAAQHGGGVVFHDDNK